MGPVDTGKTVFELVDGTYREWYIVTLVARDDGFSAILTHGNQRATVDADDLHDAVVDRDCAEWVPAMYDGEHERADGEVVVEWIPHPKHVDAGSIDDVSVDLRVAPDSPSDLTFEKIQGRGSRTEVNNFLEGADDGLVFHELGGVSSWKTAFVARYDGAIVSAIVLHHYHPSTNGVEIAISRLANHTNAPHNTSTWMIARARKWAERAGYERLATYAGVGGNGGVCYRAAGFDAVGEPVEVEGKDWTSDHHGSGDGDTSWLKQKYVYDLSPETYADKPDEWAVESVVDRVTVPGRSVSAAATSTTTEATSA
jgi:hypothetical protein